MALFSESVLLPQMVVALCLFATVTANVDLQQQESTVVRTSKQLLYSPYFRPFLNDRQLPSYYPYSYWNSPYFYYYPVSNVGYFVPPSTKQATNPPIAKDGNSSPSVDPVTGRQYFGVTNVFSAGLNNNQSCSNATCPVCDTCPTQCSAISSPAPLLYLTRSDIFSCIGLINVPRCTYLYTAPSGTFVMDFPLDSFADPQGLAVHVKIVATCPNTRIALTCPSIQQGVIISTQNTQYALTNMKVEETSGTMVVVLKIIQQTSSLSPVSTVTTCNWVASP